MGRTPEGLAKVVNTIELPRHITVGETGKFDKTGVMIGTAPSGYDLDNYGTNSKGSEGT